MGAQRGFWSYVHDDDKAEGGRITRLAGDIADQYRLLTGEPLSLFLDKGALKWGDDWRETIDAGLAAVAFFIPVLTPRYFMSAECRRELQYFAREATRLGVKELVLPVLYVDILALDEPEPADALIGLVRTFQWEDWRDLRFAELSSEPYRRRVARLAARLVEANRRAEGIEALERPVPLLQSMEPDLDSPGLLDRFAGAEAALPRFTETLQELAGEINTVGTVVENAADELNRGDASTKGYGVRLGVAKRVAKQLTGPSERVQTLGNRFASDLHEIDDGFRGIIESIPEAINADPGARKGACEFHSALRVLATASSSALGTVQRMAEAIAPIEQLSRDMRPPLRQLRQGLTLLLEGREVINEWVNLMDALGLDCDGQDLPDPGA